MSYAEVDDLKERYLVMCELRKLKPNEIIIKNLNNAAQSFLLSVVEDLRLFLNGGGEMSSTRLTDEDIDVLCAVFRHSDILKSLDLRYHNFTDNGAKFVANLINNCSCLQEVNVMCNEITEQGAAYFATALLSNSTLRSLKINGNKIGNKGGMAFAQALQVNTTLEELDVGDCDLKTESVIALATVLNHNKHLLVLNVNRPLLFSKQEETSVHFGKMLKVNNTLREIYLQKYDMRDFGVERLRDGLKYNSTLKYLDLSCNRLSRDGAAILADLLRENDCLETLDLGFNRIEKEGAISLSTALATSNNSLKNLSLVSNCIGGEGLVAVAAAMAISQTWSGVYIWGNELTEAACNAFENIMSSNRLLPQNTDVQPYVVDGRIYLSEVSHGLRRFYYWTPSYGPDVVGKFD